MPTSRGWPTDSPEGFGSSETAPDPGEMESTTQPAVLDGQLSFAPAPDGPQIKGNVDDRVKGNVDDRERSLSVKDSGTGVSHFRPTGTELPGTTFKAIQKNINELQFRQLEIQARKLEVHWAEIELKRRQLEMENELKRLSIEYANDKEKLANIRLSDAEKVRQNMAHRGQTAAIWLAYPILLGSFIFGVITVALTIAGVVGPALGGTLGVLFVGGPLLAATAKVIQSFTNSKVPD
jgi:hypothetical protein